MKVLTIKQPLATLIMQKIKDLNLEVGGQSIKENY